MYLRLPLDNATHSPRRGCNQRTPMRLQSVSITPGVTPTIRAFLPPSFVSRDITAKPKRITPTVVATAIPALNPLGAWQPPLPNTGTTQPDAVVTQPIRAFTAVPAHDPLEVSVPSTSAALKLQDGASSASQPCHFNLNTKSGRQVMINHLPSPVQLRIQQHSVRMI
jgi:hypothetical protein